MVVNLGAAKVDVVLILVLMEYGLWLALADVLTKDSVVLILVLMEYGLWHPDVEEKEADEGKVLILVLMEYGLWQ